jgi:hypothetical protein
LIFQPHAALKERVRLLTGRELPEHPQIVEEASDYMAIQAGHVLRLEGNDYLVTGEATEGRFGIDEQRKFWVKYVLDLTTGHRMVAKLVFHEQFTSRFGPFLIRSTRNPYKEAAFLEAVRGNPSFMQGWPVRDKAGNLIRVIELLPGRSLYHYIMDLEIDHRTYFDYHLKGLMRRLLQAFETLAWYLSQGWQHGDIRTDHLIMDPKNDRYVWIDFDFEVSHSDFDIWSLGNVLCFVLGKGSHMVHEIKRNPENYPGAFQGFELTPDDLMLSGQNRVANLIKLFPYIPAQLNRIVMNFSTETDFFYDSAQSLVDDIKTALA